MLCHIFPLLNSCLLIELILKTDFFADFFSYIYSLAAQIKKYNTKKQICFLHIFDLLIVCKMMLKG